MVAVSLALALLMVGPLLLSRGFALVGDMVFVPEQPWKDRWLGVDGSVPRAVPSDAVVSLASQLVPGDLLQKALLLAIVLLGGWGAARLVARHSWRAQLAATVVFVWNPFVYERLAIGHWALLASYAALPWVVIAAEDLRERRAGGAARLTLAATCAAVASPTGGVMALLVAVAVVAAGGTRSLKPAAAALGITVAVNLPWLVPGLLSAGTPADVTGVKAFASRADTPLGTLGSTLSLGGIWKEAVAPPERSVVLLAVLGLGVVIAGIAGAFMTARRGDATRRSLLVIACVGVGLAWLPATDGGLQLFEWFVTALPGGGIVRDSQKWVALLALAVAAGLGDLVASCDRRFERSAGGRAALVIGAFLPVALLPGLLWGMLGRLAPAEYPAEWRQVAQQMHRAGVTDDRVLVLPFEIYRRFRWNDDRAVLDPAPRYFPGTPVVNDALRVGDGVVVAGEDPVAERIAGSLAADPDDLPAVLRREGIGWVLVEKDTPGAADVPEIAGEVVHDGAHLRLIRLTAGPAASTPAWRSLVLAVDAVVLLGAVLLSLSPLLRRSRRGRVRADGAHDAS